MEDHNLIFDDLLYFSYHYSEWLSFYACMVLKPLLSICFKSDHLWLLSFTRTLLAFLRILIQKARSLRIILTLRNVRALGL